MKQTRLHAYRPLQEGEMARDDFNVNLSIKEIPGYLIREFAGKIAIPHYSGGIAEAIKDLMWQAIQTQKL